MLRGCGQILPLQSRMDLHVVRCPSPDPGTWSSEASHAAPIVLAPTSPAILFALLPPYPSRIAPVLAYHQPKGRGPDWQPGVQRGMPDRGNSNMVAFWMAEAGYGRGRGWTVVKQTI